MANQSYIKHVQLKGYKSIKNLEADFLPGLNIIIGDNGSGKSNFFKFIDASFKDEFISRSPFYSNISYYSDNKWNEIKFNAVPYRVDKPLEKGQIKISIGNYLEFDAHQKASKNIIEVVAFSLPNKLFLLADELIISYSPGSIYANFINVDESNLPLFFQDGFCQVLPLLMQEQKPSKDKEIFSFVKKYIADYYKSFFESVRQYTYVKDIKLSENLRVVNGGNNLLEIRNIALEYFVDDNWVGWNALSDGTKRLIYSFFLVCGFEIENVNPPIILFEEPEIGIHPHQLHLLMQFLKERSEVQQIFISTHSPQVLDILGEDDLDRITIAEIQPKEGTKFRKLNEKETLKAKLYLKETGMLSDLWRFTDFQRTKKY